MFFVTLLKRTPLRRRGWTSFTGKKKSTLPSRRGWALPLDVQGCRSAHRRCAARSPKVRQKAMDEYFQSGLCSFDSELAMSYIFGCCCGCRPAAYIRWHLLFYCVGCSHGTTLRPQRERNVPPRATCSLSLVWCKLAGAIQRDITLQQVIHEMPTHWRCAYLVCGARCLEMAIGASAVHRSVPEGTTDND